MFSFEEMMFMGYAERCQRKMDITEQIIDAIRRGESTCSIERINDFSPDEWEEIEREVSRRL